MGYEYTANTEIAENEARSVVCEIVEQSESLELGGENGSILSAIFSDRINPRSSWGEDVQFVFYPGSLGLVIHSATSDEREALIRAIEQAFEVRGIELKLEED